MSLALAALSSAAPFVYWRLKASRTDWVEGLNRDITVMFSLLGVALFIGGMFLFGSLLRFYGRLMEP